MFEAAELGRKVSKKDFEAQVPELRTQLLAAQRALRHANFSVVILVSGVEGAGKSRVVNRLMEWLDPRGVRAFAFWNESDEERERPPQWRYWRALPASGRIHVFFGSWYTQPIVKRVMGDLEADGFDREVRIIEAFERMLVHNGTLIVKFWFHIPKEVQQNRLEDVEVGRQEERADPSLTTKFAPHYERFAEVSRRAIRLTDTATSPWYIIEATNHRYRDLTAGLTLLEALKLRLEQEALSAAPVTRIPSPALPSTLTVLDRVDLTQTLDHAEYKARLTELRQRVNRQAWDAYQARKSLVAVFEGWDAAGKGGAIRRFTSALDARLIQVIPIAAPTDEEKAHHYLWRFWRQLSRGGQVTVYDRSWYGRVLVERVEGFATTDEWMRSYTEINEFEERLVEFGMGLVKIWVHISKEEQLRRFKEREQTPWKEHKITDEDWRNRDRWDDYRAAINDMVARTSTAHAPWTLVAGNNKKVSRVTILETISLAFERILADP